MSTRRTLAAGLASLAAVTLACATLTPGARPGPDAAASPPGGSAPSPTAGQPSPTPPPSTATTAPASPTLPPTPTKVDIPAGASAEPTEAPARDGSPVSVQGRFQFSNNFVLGTYMVEHAVALVDLRGFVLRDPRWPVPLAGQVLGPMRVDLQALSGDYTLSLPAQPRGIASDVDQNGLADPGVQIFALAYWPNLAGGPFSEGDDPSFGWPTYLASIRTDAEAENEIIGGSLLVWSPDNRQGFPTGFGPDGRLFTADDPVGPVAGGYTLIQLDSRPFGQVRQTRVTADLYEPKEFALKDFSGQSYTSAFESLFALVSTQWAFNGMPGKAVDWPALYARLAPRIAQAEKDHDGPGFYQAIFDFAQAIPDGHVGLSGGAFEAEAFSAAIAAGYGLAVRELEGGRYTAVFVTPGGPADRAGVKVGAVLQAVNGQPVEQAVAAVTPFSGPFSQDVFRRYQQARYLFRAPAGTQARLTFVNPGRSQPTTAALTAEAEQASFRVTSFYAGYSAPEVPVQYRILESGVGYIEIASYYDDLNLIIRLFERALKTFRDNGVRAIIVDLRYNGGGSPLGLAGFLTDQEIPLGQAHRYNSRTGGYDSTGPADRILPNQTQYRFDSLAVLVGPGCASACEAEAYGFSQVPGALVVGFYPSLGTFADVARGQVLLPEGMSLQFSTDRFLNADGSLFLEGRGVVPTVPVPLTLGNVTAAADVVLQAAEAAVLGRAGP